MLCLLGNTLNGIRTLQSIPRSSGLTRGVACAGNEVYRISQQLS